MNITRLAIATLVAAFISVDAHALGAVSRACQFSTLPSFAKGIAVQFFEAMGAHPNVLSLPNESLNIQKQYWINESLTTDYLKTRYYLYASADIYGFVANPASSHYGQWQFHTGYQSPQWTAEEISEDMKRAPNFAPYYANRGDLYSARAGHPFIVEQPGAHWGRFIVLGTHYYYDHVNKLPGKLRDTKAGDCNIFDWGVGLFDR